MRSRRASSVRASRRACRRRAGPRLRRAAGSSWRLLSERGEHDGVDLVFAVDPLLEVRDACPVAQRAVAEPLEALRDLVPQRALDAQPLRPWRRAEQAVVEPADTAQLADR